MMRFKWLTVAVITLAIPTYGIAALGQEDELNQRLEKIRKEFSEHHYTAQCEIVSHVQNSLGWNDEEYRVKFWRRSAQYLYFSLNHISGAETTARGVMGGTGNFVVVVDPGSNKIVSMAQEQ